MNACRDAGRRRDWRPDWREDGHMQPDIIWPRRQNHAAWFMRVSFRHDLVHIIYIYIYIYMGLWSRFSGVVKLRFGYG